MKNIPNFDFSTIEKIPAHELLKLSHEELHGFIQQAIDISRSAAIVANWLISIKYEKSLREDGSDTGQGGQHE